MAAACGSPPASSRLPDAGPGGIVVKTQELVVKQGAIGASERVIGTYILVDVDNKTPEDRVVAIDGTLKDAAGRPLSPLLVDEVRIPARQVRAFALAAPGSFPMAAGADVRVRDASAVTYAAPLVVKDLRTARDGAAFVATAQVENTQKGQGLVNVVCVFRGETGRILARPWQRITIDGGATLEVRFEGPASAKDALIYTGDAVF